MTLAAVLLSGLAVAGASPAGARATKHHTSSHAKHKKSGAHKTGALAKKHAKKHKKAATKKHSPAKKTSKRKPAPKKKPVTTCATTNFAPGESAYFDARLIDVMNRLVCGAADRSTIKVKAWFVSDDSPLTHRFFTNLRIMHTYHSVRVYFHVGRETRNDNRKTWLALQKQARGIGTVGSCLFACITSATDSASHSKFITVSKLRSGRPAVLQMSANITQRQLAVQHQAGVLVVGNAPVWSKFDHEFGAYWACGMHNQCRREAYAGSWFTSGGVSVYFTPSTADLLAAELKRVECSSGGTVLTSSRAYYESAVVRQLNRLATAGCTVRMISQSPPVATAAPLAPRCRMLHEKYIVIDTPGLREVISGSKDLASGRYQYNDNQEMINRSAGVLNAFKARFSSMYGGAASC